MAAKLPNESEVAKDDEKFITRIKELLKDERTCNDAVEIFTLAEHAGTVDRQIYNLLPILKSHLTKEIKVASPKIFDTCESLLVTTSQVCNPNEVLIPLLENSLEYEIEEETFACLLGPIRICLVRGGANKNIDYCTSWITSYLSKLLHLKKVTTALNTIENDENLDSMEEHIPAERLEREIARLLSFIAPLVTHTITNEKPNSRTHKYLLSLLLCLFGPPFCYIQDGTSEDGKQITTLSCNYKAALEQISRLTGNVLRFHKIVEWRIHNSERGAIAKANTETDPFISSTQVPCLAYASYYYYLLTSNTGIQKIPRVYRMDYLMPGCFYLAMKLLTTKEPGFVPKGLRLIEIVLENIEVVSIGHEFLEIGVVHDTILHLMSITIYSEMDSERKWALKIFEDYINRFTMRAKYLLILGLYEEANHSGMLAVLTSIVKDSVIYCLDQKPLCQDFLQRNLAVLLTRICRLKHSSHTDLVEVSNEIIAALNLLRFLVMRDNDQSTGIWAMMNRMKATFMEPLKSGIQLMREHWRLKIKELEKQKNELEESTITGKKNVEGLSNNVDITVGNATLPDMPYEAKMTICQRAMGALDVMEDLLTWVWECIEEYEKRYGTAHPKDLLDKFNS